MRQRQDLQEEFELLTKRRKAANGYTRYFKKRFKELTKEKPNV